MIKEIKCPDCEIGKCKYLGKSRYTGKPTYAMTCIICHNRRIKEKQNIYYKEKTKEKSKLKEKKCDECKNEFLPKQHNQRFCHNPCNKEKSNKEKWLNKKDHVNVMDSNQVAYSFFRKKYGPGKRYKICRG